MKTRLFSFQATALLLLFTCNFASALEKPEYEVLFADGKIEFRLYKSYLVAETFVTREQDYSSAANIGFKRLFDYITGDNNTSSKIAMTAPVQQAPSSEKIAMTSPVQRSSNDNGWTIAFMLPKKYELESAPVPTDSSIVLRRVPGKIMATLRYSGRWSESNFDKHRQRLVNYLRSSEIEPLSGAESAVYNPPFMPPFMRRNEIMIEVPTHPSAETDNSPS